MRLLAFTLFNDNKVCGLFKACNDPTGVNKTSTLLSKIVPVLLFAAGFIAIIMIVIAGLSYVTSGGDEKKIESAKNTIIYAVAGLIIAVLAYAITKFVLRII